MQQKENIKLCSKWKCLITQSSKSYGKNIWCNQSFVKIFIYCLLFSFHLSWYYTFTFVHYSVTLLHTLTFIPLSLFLTTMYILCVCVLSHINTDKFRWIISYMTNWICIVVVCLTSLPNKWPPISILSNR